MIKLFKYCVTESLNEFKLTEKEVITELDIRFLPLIVQKYLIYTNSINKSKVYNFRAEFTGKIRAKSDDKWMKLKSVQYNFIQNPTRIFYIKAIKMGLSVKGIHIYKNSSAIMKIKLFGLFKLVEAKGKEMDKSETVTFFNDMCFLAPATLTDNRIKWEEIDNYTVRAYFTNQNITISAILVFNEIGELINFISNDRYETTDGLIFKNYVWKTPIIGGYRDYEGYKIPVSAKLIYEHPEGDFCYGEFLFNKIEYNCDNLKYH